MSGASTSIIRLSIRPRVVAAAATSMSTKATSFFAPSLSDLFDRQCKLPSTVNNDYFISSRASTSSSSSSSAWGSDRRRAPFAADLCRHDPRGDLWQSSSRERQCLTLRWFASGAGAAAGDSTTGGPPPPGVVGSGSSQHDTWVQFQRSIAVAGFETGQTTKAKNLGKKSRGGKMDRKRKEREAEAEAALRGEDVTQLKGGEFPTLRYSDEETERLLAEAYAAIPPRAGKRGTLNLKRQKGRAFVKMQYHYKKKLERIGAHERRMAKRKRTNEEIKRCRSEAEDVRAREREYQDMVLRRWAVMNGYDTAEGQLSKEAAS